LLRHSSDRVIPVVDSGSDSQEIQDQANCSKDLDGNVKAEPEVA
jgi:hypothetical protein